MAIPASAAKPKCQGKVATIVGTRKADIIRGTAKRDIIVAKGGNDRIYAKGGNDIICAGGGNDRVFGGPGADRLWGQLGHDRLFVNAGPDFLAGQVGSDTLNGGIGVDTCFQGTGTGAILNCERPAPPVMAPPPGPSLIPLTGILAVAYGDIDGLDGYCTGDAMIARLMDSNGDGQPSAGDTVEMGKYPLDLAASAFGDWRVTSHAVTGWVSAFSDDILLQGAAGVHRWWKPTGAAIEEYFEESVGTSRFRDYAVDPGSDDEILVEASPSQPTISVPQTSRATGVADDPFIDVMMNYVVP